MNTETNTADSRIIITEPLSKRVADFIRKQGFAIATEWGVKIEIETKIDDRWTHCFGILYKDPEEKPKKRKFLWIFPWTQEPRSKFIGVLFFKEKNDENSWHFRAYGRKEANKILNPLATLLSKEFGIERIYINIIEDEPREEEFDFSESEYGGDMMTP